MMPADLLPGEAHVLKFVTDEWQATSDIAAFACRDSRGSKKRLCSLLKKGRVEREWDGNLGVHCWRLKRDLGFHRASEKK